jgi:hypothetical protein
MHYEQLPCVEAPPRVEAGACCEKHCRQYALRIIACCYRIAYFAVLRAELPDSKKTGRCPADEEAYPPERQALIWLQAPQPAKRRKHCEQKHRCHAVHNMVTLRCGKGEAAACYRITALRGVSCSVSCFCNYCLLPCLRQGCHSCVANTHVAARATTREASPPRGDERAHGLHLCEEKDGSHVGQSKVTLRCGKGHPAACAHEYATPRSAHQRRKARPTRSRGSSWRRTPWRSKKGKPLARESSSARSHARSRSACKRCQAGHGMHQSWRPAAHQPSCSCRRLSRPFA